MTGTSTNKTHKLIYILVNHRKPLAACVLLFCAFMALFVPDMKLDHGLESLYDTNSSAYRDYQEFIDTFDTDDFILLAVRNSLPVTDSNILNGLESVTLRLQELEARVRVISIANVRLPRKESLTFRIYPLVTQIDGKPTLDIKRLENLRSRFPILDYLVSRDHQTVGVIVKRSETHRFAPLPAKLLKTMKAFCRQSFPANAEIHIVGMPVIREAFERYNLQTALTFGVLSALIGVLIEIYIFKSLQVPLIIFAISALAILCGLGLMAFFGIHINMATSLSFGMVLVVTTALVIHIASHYYERYFVLGDKIGAIIQALGIVGRPCLMCALTTAVGFGSIMLCGVPMIRQFGLIMTLSVLLSFTLTITLTPFILLVLSPPDSKMYSKMSGDLLALVLRRVEQFVFTHHRFCTVTGLVVVALMTAGTFQIRTETNVLEILRETMPEAQDIRFVEQHLASINSLSLMVEGDTNAFRQAKGLKYVHSLEKRVEQMPYVDRIESVWPLFEDLFDRLRKANSWPDDPFAKPGVIKSLSNVILMNPIGRHLVGEYISDRFSRIRVNVRLKPGASDQLNRIVKEIQTVAPSGIDEVGRVVVTGHLALAVDQSRTLIRLQTMTLLLALFFITLLISIQFRSILLGLLSLIPNVFPLGIIFGMMGWLGITLDTMTILVAAISFGLSVDDTIHYLTHFGNALTVDPHRDVARCLARAYKVSAKAVISTSAVMVFAFSTLVLAPFRPSASFGMLASCAILAALVGDLVFMPAVILSSARIRRLLLKGVLRENLEIGNS